MNELRQSGARETSEALGFSYSLWSKVSMWLDVAISFLFSCFFLLAAIYVIGDTHDLLLWAGVLVMFYCAGVFLSRVYLRLKYLYVLGISYVVSHDGVSLRDGGQQQLVKWEDLTKADYLPLIPLYRLSAACLSQPIVLFMIGNLRPGSTSNRRHKLAADLLKENLGLRLKTRWLPW